MPASAKDHVVQLPARPRRSCFIVTSRSALIDARGYCLLRNSATPSSHCLRRFAYSPPVSSCLTIVLAITTRRSFGSIGTNCLRRCGNRLASRVPPCRWRRSSVHDADRHARKFVLGLLADQRQPIAVHLQARQRQKRQRPCPLRWPRCSTARRPTGSVLSISDVHAGRGECPRPPAPPPRRGNNSPISARRARSSFRRKTRPSPRKRRRASRTIPSSARPAGQQHLRLDRHRADQAVVVIRMFADQIHAARRMTRTFPPSRTPPRGQPWLSPSLA